MSSENVEKIKEAVRNGMIGIPEPAAFLFIDGCTEWTWDLEDIFGIPVFHGVDLRCDYFGIDTNDCPIIPLGRADGEITSRDRRTFVDGYLEVME